MIRRVSRPFSPAPLAAALSLLCCAALPQTGVAAEFKTVARPVVGQYIVVLKAPSARLAGEARSGADVPSVARQISSAHRANLVRSYGHVLRGFVVRADDRALARLLADPRVEYVEEDGIVQAQSSPAYPVPRQLNPPWGLDRIDRPDLPLDLVYEYYSPAPNVHAYVIDTGMLATHAEFTGRVGNGYTSIADGNGTNDCHGHGTHVAGTLGGTTYGVAKQVALHPVRVLDCNGVGTWSQIIAGMDWVRANHIKPAVANMSLGGLANASADTAAANLVAAGVTVVVAAGNDNGDACGASPARVPSVITVGSVRGDDGRSFFSNYGSCLDVFAPGSSIVSAGHTSTTAIRTMNGTSMAAPHVAGAAAVYLDSNPLATPSQVVAAVLNRSAPGRVLAAGPGSPNVLLNTFGPYAAPSGDGSLPTITAFQCPIASESGGGTYVCSVNYNSTSPAAVLWPTEVQDTMYSGTCAAGYNVTVKVTVGNRYGSVSSTKTFPCPSRPMD